jgi:hypothetical protein
MNSPAPAVSPFRRFVKGESRAPHRPCVSGSTRAATSPTKPGTKVRAFVLGSGCPDDRDSRREAEQESESARDRAAWCAADRLTALGRRLTRPAAPGCRCGRGLRSRFKRVTGRGTPADSSRPPRVAEPTTRRPTFAPFDFTDAGLPSDPTKARSDEVGRRPRTQRKRGCVAIGGAIRIEESNPFTMSKVLGSAFRFSQVRVSWIISSSSCGAEAPRRP